MKRTPILFSAVLGAGGPGLTFGANGPVSETPAAAPAQALADHSDCACKEAPAAPQPAKCKFGLEDGHPVAGRPQCEEICTHYFDGVPDIIYCAKHAACFPAASVKLLPHLDPVLENKLWRQKLDALLQEIKGSDRKSRHRSLAITHLEDVIMRLGMDMKDLKEAGLSDAPSPYPNSYDPSNKVVDKTADGLKL